MPKGLFGDAFYCTSRKSMEILGNLYGGNSGRFLFDEMIANLMFGTKKLREL